MEPLIKRDEYIKRVNKLTNSFPIFLLIGSVFIVFLYNSIGLMLEQNREALFGIEMLSNSFFQGTVITVVIYFVKSKVIGGVVRTKPDMFAKGKVVGYLPCVMGASLLRHKAGYLLVVEDQLHLYIKKVDGFVLETRWSDLSKVKLSVVHEKYNILMLLIFGFRDSIQITDRSKTVNILFPGAKVTVTEINDFIKACIS